MPLKFKIKPVISYAIIWILAFGIGTYFRTYPLRAFYSDESSEKASVYVLAHIKNNFDNQVNRTYPDLTLSEKKILSKQLFDQFIRSEGKNIHKAIDKATKSIEKSSGHKPHTPYLLASDSFYYFDLTKNIASKGVISDTLRGSKYLNKKMLAPLGHWEPLNLHPYIGYYLYSMLKFFYPNITLMRAVSFTPIVITAASLIVYIAACAALNCEKLFIFIGSIFFILARVFVKRSTFGWYDNDPYNIFFPLLILSIIFFAIKAVYSRDINPKRHKIIILYSVLPSLMFMLYAFFWQGWVFLFSIICFSTVAFFIINYFIFKRQDSLKNSNFLLASLIFFSFLFIGVSFGFSEFFKLFNEGWSALKAFLTPQLSIWPDLFISVSELKNSSLLKIIELCGGKLFFFISVLGLTLSVFDSYIKKAYFRFCQTLIILFFFIGAIFITLGAQRFSILCLVPLSLGFPMGLTYIRDLFSCNAKKFIKNKHYLKNIVNPLIIVLLLSTIIIPVKNINKDMPILLNRIYNDTWDKVMKEIKEQTPSDSIITTWWSPGHFIKAIAERRVTFDGATINFPQAYWIANIFLSQSEEEALGILRMLNNSANEASEYLIGLGIPVSKTVMIMKDIIRDNKTQAYQNLSKIIKDPDKINKLLSLTHNEPPPSYLLLYNEFVENNIQLPFLGRWNFKEIERINSDKRLIKKIPSRNSSKYINFLWKLAGGPPKYSGELKQVAISGDTLLFPENLKINIRTKECRIYSMKYGKGIPRSIFYLEDGKVVEKQFPNSNLNYSVVLYKDGETYIGILMDRFLANSLLIKLFFYDAKGLKYIHPIIKESDMTKRTRISVFEVDWKAFERDLNK